MIDSFDGKYAFLSNFYPVSISYQGLTYPSVEHAYQASKSIETFERWTILTCRTPGLAKKLGRTLKIRSNWEEIKLGIMEELLLIKFSQEPFKTMLLDTGKEELIENNYWGDTYWGTCKGVGSNHLGNLLMKTREKIANI